MRGWPRLAALVLTLLLADLALALTRLTDDVSEGDGLARSDAGGLRAFADHRPRVLVHAAKVVTAFGSFPVLLAAAVIVAAVLRRGRAPVIVAVTPALALVVTALVTTAIKGVVGRHRPPAPLRLVAAAQSSFPSGHSSESAALYLSVGVLLAQVVLRRRSARIAIVACCATMATAIGLSRLVLGVHWPTDVAAGWTLGMIVAIVATAASATRLRTSPAQPSVRVR